MGMKKSINNQTIMIGVIVSIASSIILFLVGIDETTSVTIGLLGIVISLLIDLHGANKRLEEKIFEALEFTANLQKDNFAKERIATIIRSWGKISDGNLHPLLINVAKLLTQEATDQLTSIANGEIHVASGDYGWMNVIMDEAQTEIRASSTISLNFWNSNAGKRWKDINYSAVERGIKIARVFVYDAVDDPLSNLMNEMKQKGIKVYYINKKLLPLDHRIPMLIADENLLWISEQSEEGVISRQYFSVREEHILKHKNIFEKILMESEEY